MSKSNYNKSDFNKLRYPLNVFKSGGSVDYEDLKMYPIFNEDLEALDKALIFKWIMLMYDLGSPFIDITDIKKRAIVAATEAGFPKKNNLIKGFDKNYNDVVLFMSEERIKIGRKIIQYCRLQRDPEFLQLVVYETLKIRNNEKLLGDVEVKDMASIIDTQSKLDNEIRKLSVGFLNGDDSKQTYQELIESIENEGMDFSPEQLVFNDTVRQRVIRSSVYGLDYLPTRKYGEEDLNEEELDVLRKELYNDTDEARAHFKALGIKNVESNIDID